jgi:hypothetical protein
VPVGLPVVQCRPRKQDKAQSDSVLDGFALAASPWATLLNYAALAWRSSNRTQSVRPRPVVVDTVALRLRGREGDTEGQHAPTTSTRTDTTARSVYQVKNTSNSSDVIPDGFALLKGQVAEDQVESALTFLTRSTRPGCSGFLP